MNRQRGTDVSASTYFRDSYNAAGTFLWSEPGTVPAYASSFEQIIDTARGRKSDNDCYHSRQTKTLYRTVNSFPWNPSGGSGAYTGGNYYTQTNDYPQLYWEDSGCGNQVTYGSLPYGKDGMTGFPTFGDPLVGSSLNYLSEMAIQSLLPIIKPDLSLVNSLIELKDFKRLPDLIRRLRYFIGALPKVWASSKKQTLRQITKLSSEGYLSDQFAIRPLLQDIADLIKVGRTLDVQLRKLVQNAGKIRRSRFTKEIEDFIPNTDENTELTVAYFYKPRLRRVLSDNGVKPVFRATITYSYTLPDISVSELRKRLVSKRLGFELNPQIIWNAVPWSFVVDWFLNINEILGDLSYDSLGIRTDIHKYVYSVKYNYTVKTYVKMSGAGPQITDYVLTSQFTNVVYSRRAGIPDLSRHLEVTGLNWKQFSYIGALVGARL